MSARVLVWSRVCVVVVGAVSSVRGWPQEHMDSWLQTDSQADSQTTVTGILHVLLQCLVEDRAEQRDEVAEMRRDLGLHVVHWTLE